MKVDFFDTISIASPKKQIYSRLGYSQGKTKLANKQKDKVEQYINEAQGLINLKGVAGMTSIEEVESSKIFLSEGIVFESKSLLELLGDCQGVLLMGATAGGEIIEAITQDSSGNDMMRAVVFDATASETVDSALGWITNYFNRSLSRLNQHLPPRRFSAGYGDFSLENQRVIYEALNLEKIGVSLTKTFMLVPEKSVTAVCGVKTL